MSWSSEKWWQDETKNFGYPIPTGATPADKCYGVSIWTLSENLLFGYPYISSAGISDISYGASIWTFEHKKFFGYPFIASAGVADRFRFSDIYVGEKLAENFCLGSIPAEKICFQGQVVFEKR